jgi:hypothetical protein
MEMSLCFYSENREKIEREGRRERELSLYSLHILVQEFVDLPLHVPN